MWAAVVDPYTIDPVVLCNNIIIAMIFYISTLMCEWYLKLEHVLEKIDKTSSAWSVVMTELLAKINTCQLPLCY